MSIAEELVRLQTVNGDSEKSHCNGWRVSPGSSRSSLRRRARLVDKNGETLLSLIELPSKLRNDVRNWFHLFIECSWRSVFALFAGGYLGTWTFFAFVYYVITIHHGVTTTTSGNSSLSGPCIENVHDFTSAYLFSMESQHTIGYGTRHMNDRCPAAVLVLNLQLIVGMFVQTMVGGVIIAKVLRPKKRRQEMRFSRFGVIGPVDAHDNRPALMIRLADIQEKLFLAESHVRLYMASTKTNENGEKVLLGVKDMNVGYDSGWDRVLLLWPIVVRHVIDDNSPLHGITKENMHKMEFELIMTVEGIVEATGMTFQARTSFLPDEIVWGERFKPMVVLNEKRRKYEIHYHLFDVTEKVEVEDWTWPPVDKNDNETEEEGHAYRSGFI